MPLVGQRQPQRLLSKVHDDDDDPQQQQQEDKVQEKPRAQRLTLQVSPTCETIQVSVQKLLLMDSG